MNCPFCASQWRDFQSLARHLDFKHPDHTVFVAGQPIEAVPMVQLPVTGTVDLDAIYLRRPDLVGRKAAQ